MCIILHLILKSITFTLNMCNFFVIIHFRRRTNWKQEITESDICNSWNSRVSWSYNRSSIYNMACDF